MNDKTDQEWVQRFGTYLERRFPDRSTATHYISDMQIFLRAKLTGSLLETKRADIDHFVDTQRCLGHAPATVKRRAASLKSFFDFVAEELEEPGRENPVSMRRHAGRQPEHLPRDLRDAEVKQLLEIVEEKRDLALIVVMLYAGLRVEEVINLTPADIEVPEDESQLVRLRVLGKRRKERMVYLPHKCYAVVAHYLEEEPVSGPEQPLFRNRRGQAITIAGVQWVIRTYADKSGIAVTCHRLRHTCARWLAEGEMPLLSLSRFMGHSRMESTQRYIDGANPSVRRHYTEAMSQVDSPAKQSQKESPAPSFTPSAQPATVVRSVPPVYVASEWLDQMPEWWQQGGMTWIHHCWYRWKASRRQANASNSLGHLHRFWRWQLSQHSFRTWDDLSTADVQMYVDAELVRGITPKTVVTSLDKVFSHLRFLQDNGNLAELPVRPTIALSDALPRHLQPQELLQLESYVKQIAAQSAPPPPWLLIALYYLLAHAGLRISEALDLQVLDLDLPNRRLTIREGKNRRDRISYLTTTCADALARYLQTVPHAHSDLVFSLDGHPLTYHQALGRLRTLAQASAVAHITPLRLRHTYATTLLNNGMTIDALRLLMGHKHLNTTLIYARLADTTVEKQFHSAMQHVTDLSELNSM